jgi:CheY-like chemotaxis protein
MSKTILIIEDNKDNSDLVGFLMQKAGFDVLTAVDGYKGLALAAERLPDLIVLDLMMPEMDGWTVAEQLRADPLTAEIPIVVVSALADSENKRRGEDFGVLGYITKPIEDIVAFSQQIQSYLADSEA